MTVRLRYAREAGEGHRATAIYTYRRTDGLKETSAPTVRNEALALFNADDAITHVAVMRGDRLFFLARDPLGWRDATGRAVEILEVTEE